MEKLFNSLTDINYGWWPFLKLRPQKNEIMTNKLLVINVFFIWNYLWFINRW